MAEIANKSSVDFAQIKQITESYDCKKANLIAILQRIQESYRYLPEDALAYVAELIGISPASVYGVATFYSQFSLDPKGKYEIRVCDGTACHVRGSMPVLSAIKKKTGLQEGKITSENGLFTVETVSCLGACGLAPVVVINEKVYPQMTADAILIVLDTLMKEEAE
ncbi:MAG: NAD(P)H-dependent oxidoreductase subunit E [Candidatus Gastranaerophilales bacterium]|nr:NAD(P)H-dependent oxidoreductase subunit E [Candidatus Gastranaerophilales bacterium]